jgi:hypothetical protein
MKVNYLKSCMFAAMALCLTAGFASCDDDDVIGSTPALTDVEGSYNGVMNLILAPATPETRESAAPGGTPVTAAIKNDTIEFKDLDVASLLTDLPGVEAINAVDYKLGFKAAFGKDQKTIDLKLDPKPLETTITNEDGDIPVKVTIAAAEQGVYAYDGRHLVLTLQVTKVELGDQEADLGDMLPLSIGFALTEKTK